MVGWLSHLLFDQGGIVLASDVPGAFPGCSRVRMREAITELVPELLPVFDVTHGHGGFDVVGDIAAASDAMAAQRVARVRKLHLRLTTVRSFPVPGRGELEGRPT